MVHSFPAIATHLQIGGPYAMLISQYVTTGLKTNQRCRLFVIENRVVRLHGGRLFIFNINNFYWSGNAAEEIKTYFK